MRALTYVGVEQLEMREVERPRCGEGEVLIQVEAVGICGSDVSGYLGHHARRQPPLVLGHEVAGIVVEVGPGVHHASVGDRVCVNPLLTCRECEACRSGRPNLCSEWRVLGMDRLQGAFADFVRVPEYAVHPVAAGLSSIRAACIEPLACTVHLLRLAEARPFSSLLIIGAGTQGSLIAAVARRLGFGPIIVVDVNPRRLDAARDFAGVDLTIDARDGAVEETVRQRLGPAGADVSVDAVGSTPARSQALDLCRPGGTVMFLGLHEQRSDLDIITFLRKEQRILGSFTYSAQDFASAQKLVESGEIDLTPWTEVCGLEEGPAAFRKLTTDPGSTLKIVLTPQT